MDLRTLLEKHFALNRKQRVLLAKAKVEAAKLEPLFEKGEKLVESLSEEQQEMREFADAVSEVGVVVYDTSDCLGLDETELKFQRPETVAHKILKVVGLPDIALVQKKLERFVEIRNEQMVIIKTINSLSAEAFELYQDSDTLVEKYEDKLDQETYDVAYETISNHSLLSDGEIDDCISSDGDLPEDLDEQAILKEAEKALAELRSEE